MRKSELIDALNQIPGDGHVTIRVGDVEDTATKVSWFAVDGEIVISGEDGPESGTMES